MEIMFEVFTVPAYYTVVQAALGLFASGKTIGLVVDSGEGATHTVPVYEGYCCPNAINQVSVAGGELTTYYQKLLHDRGYSFSTTEELKVVKDIKEKLSYVARNYQDELNSYEETAHCDQFYELPDGNTLLATSERFRGPEALFDPTMCGYNEDGIHHRVY
jgi:actin-related protein